jgi:rare lipoprotein A
MRMEEKSARFIELMKAGMLNRYHCVLLLAGLLVIIFCGHAYSEYSWESPYQRDPAFMKPYERFGKKYKPIKPEEAIDYREKGIASWYGADFHGLPTSNGEIYNMHDYTAAHKTLPLGLFVRVTNGKNGRSCLVRLNDRGPFVDGRIIDLSYSAAKDVGIEDVGTAPVVIEVLGFPVYQEDTLSFRKPNSYEAASYTVQVAAFKIKENAERLVESFRKNSVQAKIIEFRKKDELFYRVRVGSFKYIREAESYKDQLKKEGFPQTFLVGE